MADQASLGGVAVLGKTGTAEGASSPRTHGWFVGLAPAQNPQVVIAVFLPAGRGADAAHVAGDLLANAPINEIGSGHERAGPAECIDAPIPVAFFAPRMRSYENASSSHERLRRGVVLRFPQPGSDSGCRRSSRPPRAKHCASACGRSGMIVKLTLTPGAEGRPRSSELRAVRRGSATHTRRIRAKGDTITFRPPAKRFIGTKSRLSGPVTLTAHGETVTLHDPVGHHRACGRAGHRGHAAGGELCGARGRERERPGRQSRVVQSAGNRGAELCASRGARPRRLRPVRLHALPASALERRRRSQGRGPRGDAGDGGRNAVVPRTAGSGLFRQGLRRPHGFARRRFGRERSRFPICLRSRIAYLHAATAAASGPRRLRAPS